MHGAQDALGTQDAVGRKSRRALDIAISKRYSAPDLSRAVRAASSEYNPAPNVSISGNAPDQATRTPGSNPARSSGWRWQYLGRAEIFTPPRAGPSRS